MRNWMTALLSGRQRGIRKVLAACAVAGAILTVGGAALADSATSIETVTTRGTDGMGSTVILDENDRPTILYTNGKSVDRATCADPNCSFPVVDTMFTISERNAATIGEIRLDSRGYPYFFYFIQYGADNGRRLVRCADERCDTYTKTLIDRDARTVVVLPDEDDQMVSVYRNFETGKLKLAQCANAECSTRTMVTTIDDNVRFGWAVEADNDGHPIVLYQDSLGGTKLARCSDVTCSVPELQSLDLPSNFVPSIVVDENDRPIITVGLTLLMCADRNCTSSTTRLIDNARVSADLQLDENGYPVLAYRTSGTIRLARCHDAACADLTVEVVDEATGLPPTFVLDSQGNPAIVYANRAVESLKLARCGNPSCLEFAGDLPDVGTYYLRSVATGRYLDADPDGGVATSHVPKLDDRWNLNLAIATTSLPFTLTNAEFATSIDRTDWIPEDAGDGTFYLRRISAASRNYLSTSATGVVMALQEQSDRWEFVSVDDAEPVDLVGERIALKNFTTNRWLDFDGDGSVGQSVNQGADDVWLVEDAGDDFVYLKSEVGGRYLAAGDDFTITTSDTPTAQTRWELAAADGVAALRSARFGGYVAVQGFGDDDVVRIRTSEFSSVARWEFTILTG